MTYCQLTSAVRYMLAALRKQGLNQSQVAEALARRRSTISRKLSRNRCLLDGRYRASFRVISFQPFAALPHMFLDIIIDITDTQKLLSVLVRDLNAKLFF